MKPAVLLLLHQGRSFTAEASEAVRRLGFCLVGLSSAPEDAAALHESERHLEHCLVTTRDHLCSDDLPNLRERFAQLGYELRGALATFEGYRLFMAALNHALGAPDSSVEALARALNKLELRRALYERGMSAVRSHGLRPGDTPTLGPGTWFVKPVRGAASFAAFILRDEGDLKDLQALQLQMKNDRRMAAIFMDQFDFLIEDFVEGPELSFETIGVDEPRVICVQEKARIERLARTTLESMSVSPPVTVPLERLLDGASFVERCLSELGLNAGAFHVEAKYWTTRERWEIIEINPRMGGSLINASVQAVTGHSVLELWIESLLARGEEREQLTRHLTQLSQVEALRSGSAEKGTVFLSKYGEKGRTVKNIRFDAQRQPDVLKLHVNVGTQLEDSDRALALMDALWRVRSSDLPAEIDFLDRHAADNFHVEYD